MQNNYRIKSDYAIIDIFAKGEKYECLVDLPVLEELIRLNVKWNGVFSKMRIYAIAHVKKNGRDTTIKMHRYITSAPKGKEVDHANHNTLDNRKQNLRVCTNSENQQNLIGAKKNSKTGIRGVFWSKRHKKWIAKLNINRKMIYVGWFDNLLVAEKAVKAARARFMPYSQEATLIKRRNVTNER